MFVTTQIKNCMNLLLAKYYLTLTLRGITSWRNRCNHVHSWHWSLWEVGPGVRGIIWSEIISEINQFKRQQDQTSYCLSAFSRRNRGKMKNMNIVSKVRPQRTNLIKCIFYYLVMFYPWKMVLSQSPQVGNSFFQFA